LQKKTEDDRYRAARQVGLLTTIPALLTVSPLVGFFIGRFIDGKLHTDSIFTILFLVLGFVAGGIQVARVIRLANRESDKKD
jgi:ATP synthase protein I